MDSWSPGLHIQENTKRRAKIPSTEILSWTLPFREPPVNHWNTAFTAFNGPRLLLSQHVSLFPPPAFAQYLKDSSHTWRLWPFFAVKTCFRSWPQKVSFGIHAWIYSETRPKMRLYPSVWFFWGRQNGSQNEGFRGWTVCPHVPYRHGINPRKCIRLSDSLYLISCRCGQQCEKSNISCRLPSGNIPGINLPMAIQTFSARSVLTFFASASCSCAGQKHPRKGSQNMQENFWVNSRDFWKQAKTILSDAVQSCPGTVLKRKCEARTA